MYGLRIKFRKTSSSNDRKKSMDRMSPPRFHNCICVQVIDAGRKCTVARVSENKKNESAIIPMFPQQNLTAGVRHKYNKKCTYTLRRSGEKILTSAVDLRFKSFSPFVSFVGIASRSGAAAEGEWS